MYFSKISQVTDDVDLFHDHYPDPEMTFSEYVKSIIADLTDDHFEKTFKIKSDDHMRTVFKLKMIGTVGPIKNDSRYKNGNGRPLPWTIPCGMICEFCTRIPICPLSFWSTRRFYLCTSRPFFEDVPYGRDKV